MRGKKDKNDDGMYESVFPMTEKDIEFEKTRHENAMREEKLRHENRIKEQKAEQETFKEGQKMLKLSEKVANLSKNGTPYRMNKEEIELMSKTMTKTMHEIEQEEIPISTNNY